jgi:hypothetical protein
MLRLDPILEAGNCEGRTFDRGAGKPAVARMAATGSIESPIGLSRHSF